MSSAPKLLMIIEDDVSISESLEFLFRMEGYEVISAANGQEGLDLLNDKIRPDLILLDLMMPVMDGYKFREIQSSMPGAEDIPVVIMTADASIMSKKHLIVANDYLRKPLDVDDLLRRIQVYL